MGLLHECERQIKESQAHNQRGEYAQALDAARRATLDAAAGGSTALEIRARRAEATALILSSRSVEALEGLRWIVDVAHESTDLREIRVAHAIVSAHLDWVDFSGYAGTSTMAQRFEVLDRAQAWLEELGRPDWRCAILGTRAGLMRALSRRDEALALGEEAIRCFVSGSPGSSLASHRQQYADDLYEAGRLDSAEIQYMAILTDARRRPREEKSAHVGLARCALRRGDVAGARHRAERALGIARPLGDAAMVGPLEVLAEALTVAGELDHAGAVADQLIERARASGSRLRLFYAVRRQIDLAFERADEDGARAWLDEASALAAYLDGAHGDRYGSQVRRRQLRLDSPPSSPSS